MSFSQASQRPSLSWKLKRSQVQLATATAVREKRRVLDVLAGPMGGGIVEPPDFAVAQVAVMELGEIRVCRHISPAGEPHSGERAETIERVPIE
jgi:hypothetical protein